MTQIAHGSFAFERGRARLLKGVTSPLRLSELLWDDPTGPTPTPLSATPRDDIRDGIGLLALSMDSWLSGVLDGGRFSTILALLARR